MPDREDEGTSKETINGNNKGLTSESGEDVESLAGNEEEVSDEGLDKEGIETTQDDKGWEEAFKDITETAKELDEKVPEEGIKDEGDIHPPDFSDLRVDEKSIRGKDLEFILDIPLEVTAELGKTKMLINDLLRLGQGSIIELEKLAGEPVEILVNGRLIAKGEVVVVNDKFGVRLSDIVSPSERVKRLA